ncbi:MAG: protease inhibitor I42 family protein [Leptothrix sp. (in: b-proteobacteria)]
MTPPPIATPGAASEQMAAQPMAVGEDCVIRLPSNPSTGYRWELLPVDPPIVQLQGAVEFEPHTASAGLVGMGGEEVFRLRAQSPGEVTLRWVYRRAWEASEPPADTRSLRVIVR